MITGSESDPAAQAQQLLEAVDRDPHVAQVLDHIAGQLRARVRTDTEDKGRWPVDDIVADRYRLLGRMARRYASAPHARRHPAAALMLAAISRLGDSGQLHVV